MKKAKIPFELRDEELADGVITSHPHFFIWHVCRQGYTWWPGGSDHLDQLADCTPWFDEEIPPSNVNQVTGLGMSTNDPTSKMSVGLYPSMTQRPLLIPKGRWTALTRPPLNPVDVGNNIVVCLHREFAKLRDRSIDEDILKFAGLYGPLLSQRDDRLVDVEMDGQPYPGESLALWWDEILQMSVYLALWDLARSEEDMRPFIKWPKTTDPPRIRFTYRRNEQGGCSITEYVDSSYRQADFEERIRRKLIVSQAPREQKYRESKTDYPNYHLDKSIPGSIDEELGVDLNRQRSLAHPVTSAVAREWVNGYVAGEIAAKLSPMKARMIPPKWKMVLTPPSLLEALWLMFAWEVSEMIHPYQCDQCQRWFHKEGKKTFCTPECYRRYRYLEDRKKGKDNKPAGGKP